MTSSLSWISRALVLAALALGACAAPTSRPPARSGAAVAKGDPFSGHYAGTWRSEATGHRGKLFCDFTRIDARHYRADFKAYWSVLSGHYSVVFETQQAGRELRFRGEHDLGKVFGGVYRYQGRVTGGQLRSNFESNDDRGVFVLERLRGAAH